MLEGEDTFLDCNREAKDTFSDCLGKLMILCQAVVKGKMAELTFSVSHFLSWRADTFSDCTGGKNKDTFSQTVSEN